jgi:hypothetical protein
VVLLRFYAPRDRCSDTPQCAFIEAKYTKFVYKEDLLVYFIFFSVAKEKIWRASQKGFYVILCVSARFAFARRCTHSARKRFRFFKPTRPFFFPFSQLLACAWTKNISSYKCFVRVYCTQSTRVGEKNRKRLRALWVHLRAKANRALTHKIT